MIWAVVVLAVIAGILCLACIGLQVQLRIANDRAAGWERIAGNWKQTAEAWRDGFATVRQVSDAAADTRRVTAIMDRLAREFPVVKH